MYLTHALRAILRTAVATGDALWKYVSLLLSGTPPTQTFIADASVNAHVLTLNGDVRPSNLNPYVEGYYSNFFDGTGDYLSAPSNAVFGMSTDDFTWEAWVYPTQIANGSGIISIGSVELYIRNSAGGNTVAYYDGSTVVVTSASAVTANQWSHVALVRSSGNLKIYLNGVGGTGVSYSSSVGSNSTCYIGVYSNLSSDIFTGYISNLRILKGTAVYTANFTPPTAPLTAIANTSLLTCQSKSFVDNSANNFAITRTGDVAVRGFVPFTPPTTVNVNTLYSTYFDGSGDYLSVPANSVFQFVGDYTIEFWVNFGTVTGNQDLISNYNAGGAADWIVMMSATGIQYYPSSASSYVYTGAGSVISNTWYHVAAVRSGNTCSLYLNGVSVGTPLTFSGTLGDNTKPIYIGSRTGTGGYFTGCMSNLRVVKGTAVYTANFTPPTSPLTAISGTSLLTCQNATIIDNSTNALTITSYGQAQPDAISPFTQVTTPVTATYLGSGYFDGTGDYLSATGSALGAGAFTIEMWVYMTSYPNAQNALYSNGTSDSTSSIATVVYINSSGTLAIYNYPNSITTSTTVPLNQWNHIAVVRNSGTINLYINGVNSGSGSNSNNITDTAVQVMRGFGGILNSPIGYVADVRVVKGTALYTANFAPPATPLTAVANTSLLTLQTDQPAANKQFVDNSGNNLVITQAGNATQGAFSPYGANWSNYFDGAGDYLSIATSTAFGFGTGDFTIEFWAYSTSTSRQDWVDISDGTNRVLFYYTGSAVTFYGNGVTAITGAALVTNAWVHYAVVKSSGSTKLYVNGTQAGSTYATNQNYGTTAAVSIGKDMFGSTYITGNLSNFRIVKGTAVYTAAFTPPTAPLTPIAGTSLITCQSPSLVDNSINGFAITRNGDVSVQRFSPFSPVIQAPVSYSTYFDGSGDYLSAPDDVAFTMGSGDFTIECWINLSTLSGSQMVIGTADAPGNQGSMSFVLNVNSGTPRIGVGYGNAVYYATAASTITANTWVHLAGVRNGASVYIYVNGVQSTALNMASLAINDSTQIVAVGRNGNYNGEYVTGYISNVRIVKGTAVYTTAFTPPTAPLTAIANTSLLTCQSPTIVDNSSNAFPITVSGNAIARSQNPFGFTNTTTGTAYTPALYGGSAYFDGSGDYLQIADNVALQMGTGSFSIEFWINFTSIASYQTIFSKGYSNAGSLLIQTNTGTGRPVLYSGGSLLLACTGSAATANTWIHYALVRNGTTLTWYTDGVVTGTTTNSTNIYNAEAVVIGTHGGLTYFLNGYLSDLRITKGQALYTGGFVPPIAPLQAVKNTVLLLNMDKSGITDSSRCVDLETVGDAKIRYESPYSGSYYSNYFDGSGDYLTVPSNAAFQFGTGDFTIEFWINASASGSYTQTVGTLVSAADDGTWRVGNRFNNGNQVYFARGTGAGFDEFTANVNVNDGAWHHVAVTRASGTMRIFVDGAIGASSTSITGTCTSSNQLFVGLNGRDNAYMTGFLSNLRLVKGTALYTANFTPSTTPLTAIANTSLLTCQSKSFVDNSSNNFTLTRNGDVAVKSLNPFQANIANSSMYFDGTGDYLTAPNNGAFDFSTGDFTVEAWVYTNGTQSQYANIVCQGSTAANTWYLSFGTSNTVTFSNFSTNFLVSSSGVTNNTWTHVAVSRSGTSLKMFLNGVQTASATNSSTLGATVTLFVGFNNGASYFNGYIADLRITKAARYTANFTPPTAPLPTA